MKAREYAAEYYASENKGEALVEIANKFVREFGQLAQSRNITRVESAVSLFKEHENKWVKFIELIDQPIRKDGLRGLLRECSPELMDYIEPHL